MIRYSFLTAPWKWATLWQIAKFWAVEGAKDVATYDLLTKWKTSVWNVAMGAIAWPVIGMWLKWLSKWVGYLSKLPDTPTVNKSKAGAYTEAFWKVRSNLPKHIIENDLGLTPTERAKFRGINQVEPWEYIFGQENRRFGWWRKTFIFF